MTKLEKLAITATIVPGIFLFAVGSTATERGIGMFYIMLCVGYVLGIQGDS